MTAELVKSKDLARAINYKGSWSGIVCKIEIPPYNRLDNY